VASLPPFAQQHHLHALALRLRDFAPQRRFQFSDLLLSALDHPFPPNHMAKRITSQASAPSGKSFDSISCGTDMRSAILVIFVDRESTARFVIRKLR
jgi:hypothetical protein